MIKNKIFKINDKIGHLLIQDYNNETKKFICLCECGSKTEKLIRYFKDGRIPPSCGCMLKQNPDRRQIKLENQKIGRWQVLRWDKNKIKYEVLCDCGSVSYKTLSQLTLRKPKTDVCNCKREKFLRGSESTCVLTRQLYSNYIGGANKRNIAFDLSLDIFFNLIRQNCEYCGSPPKSKLKSRNKKPTMYVYNGVDRVDNSLGYSIENCVPCCKICNIAKNTLTHEEWLEWLTTVRNYNYPKKFKNKSR